MLNFVDLYQCLFYRAVLVINMVFDQVIDYCTLPIGNPVAEGRRALIRNMWTDRIQGAKRNVEVYTLVF